MQLDTPKHAFQELRQGYTEPKTVAILLKYLDELYRKDLLDELSNRVSRKNLARKEKLVYVRRLSEKVFRNAAFEALQAAADGSFRNLDELVDNFGIFLRYWILNAVIKEEHI